MDKIKIFRSASSRALESMVNDWLKEILVMPGQYEIKNIITTESNDFISTTVWYRIHEVVKLKKH